MKSSLYAFSNRRSRYYHHVVGFHCLYNFVIHADRHCLAELHDTWSINVELKSGVYFKDGNCHRLGCCKTAFLTILWGA
jgi:hypothetical protein